MRKPYTLTLGSGFFGFFAHLGVLKALLEQGLAPARLTGASSGALIAGCWAAGMQLPAMEQLLLNLKRSDFWDPVWPGQSGFGRGLLRGEKFRALLRAHLPAQDFSQTRVPLALSVWNASRARTEVWSSGDLVEAIYASCALPVLFQPLIRDGERLLDGGVRDRPALAGVAEAERVFIHHLASKSPWRRASDPALRPPERSNGLTLVLRDLPRCGPFALEQGPKALQAACLGTLKALQQRVSGSVVEMPAQNLL